ncbi:CGNR zinc finger domain-containing protein [Catenulispora subtropica]|uniref:CGNR zinc finger domain-containing protein n=1 Tax=Catenulispora subtropica TaxID=450798 RepID=A0ABN2RGT3_9ACTN
MPPSPTSPTSPTAAPAAPLALDYANTLSASRGRASDHLAAWLADHGVEPEPRFGPLRDAIRTLIAAAADEEPYPAPALATVNAASASAPQWLELTGSGEVVAHASASETDRMLADLARSAIALLSDDHHAGLRACQAPGCVQFFVRTHHRQEFCGAACGNRARAARHYQRRKEQEDPAVQKGTNRR